VHWKAKTCMHCGKRAEADKGLTCSKGSLTMGNYYNYWGKASKTSSDDIHLLPYHQIDVAIVTLWYLKQKHVKSTLKELLKIRDEDYSDFSNALAVIVALHDIGKYSHNFQSLNNPSVESIYSKRNCFAHDSFGLSILKRDNSLCKLISSRLGLDFSTSRKILRSSFAHHGLVRRLTRNAQYKDEVIFTNPDNVAMREFVEDLFVLFPFEDERVKDPLSTLANHDWLTVCIVSGSDWLGSNDSVFTYCSEKHPLNDYVKMAQSKLENSDICRTSLNVLNCDDVDIYGNYNKRPLQSAIEGVDIDKDLYFVEDVTGSGKTEAALDLAVKIGKGITFLLPTQATANAIFRRLDIIFKDTSVCLSHGKASKYYGNSVLASSRRLSGFFPYSVATIDQALKFSLKTEYNYLALLFSIGKTVIVDECHSADRYMMYLLKGFLKIHFQMGGKAIIMSATLSAAMKNELVRDTLSSEIDDVACRQDAFPLITSISKGGSVEKLPILPSENKIYEFIMTDNLKDVQNLVKKGLERGQSVGVIVNTVAKAQEMYEDHLTFDLEYDSLLFHSRFIYRDRQQIERKLNEWVGKDSNEQTRRAKLVVGTQILEQSLDIDFDILVVGVAPIDYIIQRCGRYMRHARNKSGNLSGMEERENTSLVIFTDESATGADRVYGNLDVEGDAVLDLTVKALTGLKGVLDIHQESRQILDGIYKSSFYSPNNVEWSEITKSALSIGSKFSNHTVVERNAKTRLDEHPSIEVTVCKDNFSTPIYGNELASQIKIPVGRFRKYEDEHIGEKSILVEGLDYTKELGLR